MSTNEITPNNSNSSSSSSYSYYCPETSRLTTILQDYNNNNANNDDTAAVQVQGLIFDCDGTLLDTMPLYYESWKLTCRDYGLLDLFPIERFYSFAGRPVRDIFQTLLEEQQHQQQQQKNDTNTNTTVTAKQCEETKRMYHTKLMEERGGGQHHDNNTSTNNQIDVVVDIVKKYYGKLPMAVASSGWRDHVLTGLQQAGILHMFDAVVTACDEEVRLPKPAPDIFLIAAQRLQVDPQHCIGFEDADLGIQALHSAQFLYASDVRKLYMYPRNIEKRQQQQERLAATSSA